MSDPSDVLPDSSVARVGRRRILSSMPFSDWSRRVNPQRITDTHYFDLIVVTLGFGILFYTADIITDLFTGYYYFNRGDPWWALLTLALILAPGLLRGTYEVLRRPVIYQNAGFVLLSTETRLKNTFSLGLDVLPNLQITVPSKVLSKIIMIPIFILIMAVWFPFLPLLQYMKVLKIQWKILKKSRHHRVDLDELDLATEEVKKAISIKAVESFMEAAPQFFLQVYIAYHKKDFSIFQLPMISMLFSFLSLLKTSFDLQEIDRMDHAYSSPTSFLTYFVTSIAWFLSTLTFRCVAVSVLSMYLNQYSKGLIAIPIVILVLGNVSIMACFKKSESLLHGCMATVCPSRFICPGKRSLYTEQNTMYYLIVYTVFNTFVFIVSLVTVYLLNPDIEEELHLTQFPEKYLSRIFLPLLATFGALSCITVVIHWLATLRWLFRTEARYPNYSKYKHRVKSFPKNWQTKYDIKSTVEDLSSSGLFYLGPKNGERTCCYECGLILAPEWLRTEAAKNDIHYVHATSRLLYQMTYLPGDDSNPVIGFQSRVRRSGCGVLDELKIDLKVEDCRLQSFYVSGTARRDDLGLMHPLSETAAAGFVATSVMTAACFTCYASLDWSDFLCKKYSPWALHAWRVPAGCEFLARKLSKEVIRMKTFPEEWLALTEVEVPKPKDLAAAGFYCAFWHSRRAFVRCYACPTHAFYTPTINIKDEEQLEKVFGAFGWMPGKSYGYMGNNEREKPLVEHYLQSPNCGHVQQLFSETANRLKTFPSDWNPEISNGLTSHDIAAQGFVYYPVRDKKEQELMEKFKPVVKRSTDGLHVVRCPRCEHTVDFSKNTVAPSDLEHCLTTRNLLKEIKGLGGDDLKIRTTPAVRFKKVRRSHSQ